MTKYVLIPVYKENVNPIIDFYRHHFEDFVILVADDYNGILRTYFKDEEFETMYSNDSSLRGVLLMFHWNYYKDCEYLIINEHDIIPKIDTVLAAMHCFEEEKKHQSEEFTLASVGVNYKWNGFYCYPYHPNWHEKDEVYNKKYLDGLGDVRKIGGQGIPFSFSIWDINAFTNMYNWMPEIWKLDAEFGKFLHQNKWYFLRLLDYHVIHRNKGVSSWKDIKR